MADTLQELTSGRVLELRPEWRIASQEKLLAEAREMESQGGDRYWEWVAQRMRWQTPWTTLRDGEFGAFRYYAGGVLNVADNCVDRYADDAATSNKHALIWEGEDGTVRRLTYLDLKEQVSRFANALREVGIGRGDVVAIHLPNLPEAFVAIHACNRLGAIYTVLFSGFSKAAIAMRLQASRASVVVTADASLRRGKQVPLLENMRSGRAASEHVRHTVVVNRTGEPLSLEEGETEWRALLDRQSPDCPCEPMEANDPAFLIFTSGTESKPKGVVHSTAGFLTGTWANVQWQIGPQPDDVYWCAADVGWLTFPIQAVIGGLAHGMTLLCYEGALDYPDKTRMLAIAKRHGVTKILVAPTGLRMLRAAGDQVVEEQRPSTLRLVTTQGEPLDPETGEWTTRMLGVPVINAYGQTETGSTWTMPVYGVDPLKYGSCGGPVPGHTFAILDDEGTPVGPGVRGNLVLTQPFPTLARTIWDDPKRYVQSYFQRFPGYYATSDEAVLDRDGQLWVLGRSDDVINVAAHRISTMEIESAASGCDGVVEAAVVGVRDTLRGTVPVAFVTLKPGIDPAIAATDVSAYVEKAVGTFARLGNVFVSTALPKTRAGKIMRRLLREAAETGAITGDTSGLEDPGSLEAVLAAVRER